MLQDDEEEAEEDQAPDSKGIEGWDRVDRLAEALLFLKGLSVSNSQAAKIADLHSALIKFDKYKICPKVTDL